jgi:hypothetical protein
MNSIQCQPVDVDGKQENKDRTRTANIRKFLWGFFISLIKIFFFFFLQTDELYKNYCAIIV